MSEVGGVGPAHADGVDLDHGSTRDGRGHRTFHYFYSTELGHHSGSVHEIVTFSSRDWMVSEARSSRRLAANYRYTSWHGSRGPRCHSTGPSKRRVCRSAENRPLRMRRTRTESARRTGCGTRPGRTSRSRRFRSRDNAISLPDVHVIKVPRRGNDRLEHVRFPSIEVLFRGFLRMVGPPVPD